MLSSYKSSILPVPIPIPGLARLRWFNACLFFSYKLIKLTCATPLPLAKASLFNTDVCKGDPFTLPLVDETAVVAVQGVPKGFRALAGLVRRAEPVDFFIALLCPARLAPVSVLLPLPLV